MRIKQRIATAITADADGIALAQAPTAATALTLEALAASLSPARELTFTSAADMAAVVFTIVGKDRWGGPITETVTGINANTVRTTKIYSVVTSITPSASDADTLTVGFTADSVTPWIILANAHRNYVWHLRVFLAGTATYDVEATSQSLNQAGVTGEAADDVWKLQTALTGNLDSPNLVPYAAVRIRVTAQSANVTMRVLPSVTGA